MASSEGSVSVEDPAEAGPCSPPQPDMYTLSNHKLYHFRAVSSVSDFLLKTVRDVLKVGNPLMRIEEVPLKEAQLTSQRGRYASPRKIP